jgi:hypothetical protein
MESTMEIVITRHIHVTACRHDTRARRDVLTHRELVPGQRLRVRDEGTDDNGENCFRMHRGFAMLLPDAWVPACLEGQ